MALLSLPGSPDLLALAAADPARYPCLLQTPGPAGWDILFAQPRSIRLVARHDAAGQAALLAELDRPAEALPLPAAEAALPFRGGWFVYLGYEMLRQFEPSVPARPGGGDFPLAALLRVPAAIMVDRTAGVTHYYAEDDAAGLIDRLRADLARAPEFVPAPLRVDGIAEEPAADFLAGVRRIKDYIRAGDVFQVNLARRWRAGLAAGDAAAVYARLRAANPAPFSGLVRLGEHALISSSPERLVTVRDGRVETRPIAGTHPRSSDAAEDARLRQALIDHPKERAEHIMLVDLERNDLGRLCMPGSVAVSELMAVRSYAYVHHIESTVAGRLRPEVTPKELLRALFPGGTITGCPKVRTMQIIAELETTPRLAYTGSMGYINRDGGMDLNILIRSFMQAPGELAFKAGAGIVADSDPERELAETRAKARGLLRALED